MAPIFEDDIQKILKSYKIDRISLEQIIIKLLAKHAELKALVETTPLKDITRLAVYKSFIKEVKKEVYYSLRRYHQTPATNDTDKFQAIAKAHISTKERLPYLQEFNTQLVNMVKGMDTIIDMGGGVYPLLFPFNELPNIKKYIWVDKDKTAYESVKLFASTISTVEFNLFNHNIGTEPYETYQYNPQSTLILMFKLIPVVWRQDRELIQYLADFPAEDFLITASKEAMTKNINIEKREDIILNNFIKLSNRTVKQKLEVGNEFGYLL